MTAKIFKNRDKLLMLIPVFGWIFIVYGLLFPIQNTYIKVMWIIDIVLSIGAHPLQLFISLPVGKKSGCSIFKTVCLTLILGATWWKPLRNNLSETI